MHSGEIYLAKWRRKAASSARKDSVCTTPMRAIRSPARSRAQGRADWGVAILSVARAYGLGFLPLADEHYDFFVSEARLSRPAVRAFLAALSSEAVRERLVALGFVPVGLVPAEPSV